MSTSTVRFRNRHFDTNDAVLEVLLKLMSARVKAMRSPPAWLQEAKDDWELLATQEFGFGAAPDFDGVVLDDARVRCMRELVQHVAEQVHQMGDPIPAAVLNALGTGQPDSLFTTDVPAKPFREGALALAGLFKEDT